MTANDIYTVAGNSAGAYGTSGAGGPATSALLNQPMGLTVDAAGDIFIVDSNNNRIQEVAAANGTQWGVSMTANDMYTIAGSASGLFGTTGDGGQATSALLASPIGVALDPFRNLVLTHNDDNPTREDTA